MKITFVFFVYIFYCPAFAHPGPSDIHGCHINSDNGRQHCHKIKKTQKKTHKISIQKKKNPKKKKS